MKAHKRNFRKSRSGQLLLVAALAIAILIASASIYVYESNVEQSQSFLQTANFVPAVKQCTKNTLISSLANISNGGAKTVLTTNLEALAETLRGLKRQAIFQLAFSPYNDSDYESGVWLLWGAEGFGISSVYVSFTLNVQGAESATLDYAANITTTVLVEGSYTDNITTKNITATCKVYNEGKPAQANNISLFYELNGAWIQATSLNDLLTVDFGNGTYTISFSATIPSEPVRVSVHVTDTRGIFVYANATCTRA